MFFYTPYPAPGQIFQGSPMLRGGSGGLEPEIISIRASTVVYSLHSTPPYEVPVGQGVGGGVGGLWLESSKPAETQRL